MTPRALFDEKSFIHGDGNRIFLNTSAGCNSNCSYCYLPDLGFSIGTKSPLMVTSKDIIREMSRSNFIRKGREGTVFSIGCYSECWDVLNRASTLELLAFLLQTGNPIQIATKRFVDPDVLAPVLEERVWSNQLSLYISSATISQWEQYERGTTNPNRRFESFRNKTELDVPMFLYIKPVIQSVTIQDVEIYKSVAQKWRVNAIVGDMFKPANSLTKEFAPIAGSNLRIEKDEDRDVIAEKLVSVCNVYRNSTEAIYELRNGH